MASIRCADARCRNHNIPLGPVVGDKVMISLGKRLYVGEGVLAFRCEVCSTVAGEIPEPAPGETGQEVRCPHCPHGGGLVALLYRGFAHARQGRREIWLMRLTDVECECGHVLQPRYELPRAVARFAVGSSRPYAGDRSGAGGKMATAAAY